jgi:hypothetical protein
VNADLLTNSFIVFERNWGVILAILVFVLWGTALTFAILKKITEHNLTDMELITLALGGWPLPALFVSILILLLRTIIPGEILLALAIIFILVSAGFAIRAVWKDAALNIIIIPLTFFVFIFIRLGFSANIILPPYFDSAEHYRIIRFFLNIQDLSKFTWPTTSYYHVGYHMIVAALTSITHENIGQVMLLFGQIVLAAIPFPVYFFVYRATKSHIAALFGIALAAFGWFMPAHSINWGKYPALLSLLVIQFTLGMVIIKHRWMFALNLLASVLIHSRSIILLAIFATAWMVSNRIQDKRKLFLALSASMLGMAVLLIVRNQVLGPVLEPYRIWVTLLVGLLSVSVFQSSPRLIFFSMLAMMGMLAATFIPVFSSLTLLDRPLVEMILFLPLAFLGGLGSVRLPKFAVILLTVLIIFHALTTFNFSPSDCCQLAGRDDAAALDWMDHQLPANGRIAIASADLSIDTFSVMQGTATDAGVWVAPLTGRAIINLPYFTDFTSQEVYDSLCQQQVTYIYIGSRPQSFAVDFMRTMPARYGTIFQLPNAQIVQVLGCGNK